jgi:hypothetical protein
MKKVKNPKHSPSNIYLVPSFWCKRNKNETMNRKILFLMLYLKLSLALTVTLVRPNPKGTRSMSIRCSSLGSSSDRKDEVDTDFDDDDDDIKPYGNRSLAWTKRYRKLLPYEEARKRVLSFGHRSKEDWDECVENGWQGAYVPARPDEMYAKEWESVRFT